MSNIDHSQAKRLKTENAAITSPRHSPRSIVTWNCNGFVTRCKHSVPELKQLLQKTNHPDVICLQEARLKAHSCQCRGQPMASELHGPVERVLNTIFAEYTPFWSLADNRYAGTLTLLHGKFQNVPVAYSLDSAIDLLLKRYDLTRDKVGIPKIGGGKKTPTTHNEPTQQKSIYSFFQAKPSNRPKPSSNKRSRSSSGGGPHDEEGRIQFFLFGDMDLLQTYVPNHGNNLEKWERRKEWDLQVLEFVQQRQKIVMVANRNHHRSLLVCGDLNVAHQYMDGTHWEPRGKDYYEWWTDESKCVIGYSKNKTTKDPQYVGMPSFTPTERTRFTNFLETGNFVDVWRHLHPEASQNWNAPHWTWRGKGIVYENRGQRLDYFLLEIPPTSKKDEEVAKKVESCRILGTGNHKGLFCGSDHCVSLLVLKEENEAKE